jgi:CheY-like chemotaxis protein/anti-sigma regulatory factor (Ser/Thr protein kinase)
LGLIASEFSPSDLLRTVTESFESEALKRGLRLYGIVGSNIPATAVGDAERLRQLLGNLVRNALKFTEQGEIRIKMSADQVEPNTVVLYFAVEDTGVGIRPEKLDEIFEPFTQAHEFVTSRYGGSGLGLTICRQLARQMGGSIEVESSPGVGSIFRFNVRLQSSRATAPIHTVHQEPVTNPLSGLNILLAEDNEENIFLAQAYLGDAATIGVARDGREAVDKFVAGKFDVVLMDIRMPEMDGLQATRLIRQWERSHERSPTPIIAYTAHADSVEASLRAGCNGHLVKGVSAETVLATVAKYVNASPTAAP